MVMTQNSTYGNEGVFSDNGLEELTIHENQNHNATSSVATRLKLKNFPNEQPISSERSFETGKLKERQSQLQKEFDEISFTVKTELHQFELGRVDDFRNNVEIYVESFIKAQKETIELYETFYQKHIV
ncbi:VPS5 [Candida jiufengensis]|uniref:VPS5 n=1 Tax=Candida jiufengensis TaxID=497108 RepID=UPI0022250DEC|nr:VPS5 [Candida jiufengensis]KAI5954929.1 VPS5 [Candida jiufengensis]